MRHPKFVSALAFVVCACGLAFAANQTIRGKQELVKDPRPGTDPTKRLLIGQASEKQSDDTVVGDPMVGGAVLTFFAEGASSTTQAFVLPAGGWRPRSGGFAYKDPQGLNGPVTSAQLTKSRGGTFLIKAKALGKRGAIHVVPPNPGTAGCLLLQVVGGDAYHVFFGPGSAIKRNDASQFLIRNPVAEGLCPGTGPVTTTSTSTTVTTTSSSTSTTAAPSIRCCLPGSAVGAFICNEETAGQCATAGGADLGPGPCTPNPCSSGSTTTSTTVATTSTTSSSTTTSSTSTTTTTAPPILPPLLPLTVEFASVAGDGNCGVTRNGSGGLVRDLPCGDLAIGGGASRIPLTPLPDGAVNHFSLNATDLGCVLSLLTSCPLGPTTASSPDFDCTSTGCAFGAPLPIPNGSLSACAVNTFAAPATGTVNLVSGATTANVMLSQHVFFTGNAAQPCPRCTATGAPGAVGSGVCDRGARSGLSCTTRNSQGASSDCTPGGSDGSIDLGSFTANLSPLTTGTASTSSGSGLFCAGQATAGCFGDAPCRSITETGQAPLAALSAISPQPATLASVFCVPSSGSSLIDSQVNLPGPAAVSVPGRIRAQL